MATQSEHASLAPLAAGGARIILGTSSRFRRRVFDELCEQTPGLKYEVQTADIDEKAIRRPHPADLVAVLAEAKADAILKKMAAAGSDTTTGLLVTCDQVVTYKGEIREKPESEAQLKGWVKEYSAAPVGTTSSVRVANLATGKVAAGVDVTEVHFDAIPEADVDAMIQEGDVLWCAGGLMLEHPRVTPHCTKLVGTMDSVMGLPKALLCKLLLEAAH
ncbi:unnamed protein product [Pedinophyceae sp. YPF-701]|nr:unnamed protein product [Pedinophyceae sp. YPF-701]